MKDYEELKKEMFEEAEKVEPPKRFCARCHREIEGIKCTMGVLNTSAYDMFLCEKHWKRAIKRKKSIFWKGVLLYYPRIFQEGYYRVKRFLKVKWEYFKWWIIKVRKFLRWKWLQHKYKRKYYPTPFRESFHNLWQGHFQVYFWLLLIAGSLASLVFFI